jgi:hypothetical protein
MDSQDGEQVFITFQSNYNDDTKYVLQHMRERGYRLASQSVGGKYGDHLSVLFEKIVTQTGEQA